ncbi:ribose-phosphate diphosphokinase [Roseicyclus sp.]|uniref:ribose-phosphate diphosphokinase n=1 Tax=Roseicyclus sp. TaxID=1914329 RepID=UPI003F6D1B2D
MIGTMLFFTLQGAEGLGQRIAALGGWGVAPHEERDFDMGEHKGRPLVDPRGHDVFVLAALQGGNAASCNDRLIRAMFFCAACRDLGAARVSLIAPYLPYGRKDRRTKEHDPISARYVAQAIEAMGCDQIVTVAAHNIAAFENAFRIPTLHLTTEALFAALIAADDRGAPCVVMAPDPGGIKRAQLLYEALQAIGMEDVGFAMMEKRRSAGVVSGTLFAGDVAGARVYILDDMICGGGTIARAAQAARKHGAVAVHAMATHGFFTPQAIIRLAQDDGPDTLTVTDSAGPFIRPMPELRVVGLAPMLAAAIARLHGGPTWSVAPAPAPASGQRSVPFAPGQ